MLSNRPTRFAWKVALLVTGMTLNFLAFSFIQNLVLRPLPFADPNRLFVLESNDHGTFQRWIFSPDVYETLAKNMKTAEAVGAFSPGTLRTRTKAGEQTLNAMHVSHNLLPILGIRPVLGRGFTADEDRRGAHNAVMISQRFWEREFGKNPLAVNSTLIVNGAPSTIVGILPESANLLWPAELWTTKVSSIGEVQQHMFLSTVLVQVIVRAQPWASPAEIGAEAARMSEERRGRNRSLPVEARPIHKSIWPLPALTIWILYGITIISTVTTAWNLGVSLLNEFISRRAEFGIRMVLGASVGRLFLQMSKAVLALIAVSVAISAPAALALQRLIVRELPVSVQSWMRVELDLLSLLYLVAASLLVGLAACGLPILWLSLSGRDLAELLRGGGRDLASDRGLTFFRLAVVSLQTSFAFLLLWLAVYTSLTLYNLRARIGDLDPGKLAVLELRFQPGHHDTMEAQIRYASEVLDIIRARPEVAHAGAGTTIPLRSGMLTVRPTASDGTERVVDMGFAGEGFLEALSIRAHGVGSTGPALLVRKTDVIADRHFVGTRGASPELRLPGIDPVNRLQVVGSIDPFANPGFDPKYRPQVFMRLEATPLPVNELFLVARLRVSSMPDLASSIRPISPDVVIQQYSMEDLTEKSLGNAIVVRDVALILAVTSVFPCLMSLLDLANALLHGKRRNMAIRTALGASAMRIALSIATVFAAPYGVAFAVLAVVSRQGSSFLADLWGPAGAWPFVFTVLAAFLLITLHVIRLTVTAGGRNLNEILNK